MRLIDADRLKEVFKRNTGYDYADIIDMQPTLSVNPQEPILDKIRVEIDQKQYDFMEDGDYEEGIRFGLMLAYQIVDKYRAESEPQESEVNNG